MTHIQLALLQYNKINAKYSCMYSYTIPLFRDSDTVGTEFVVSICDGDDISDADIVEGNSPSILYCIN